MFACFFSPCRSANELITYEALGLCPIGGAGKFIDDGDNTYGGKYVVNPSGGLISKVGRRQRRRQRRRVTTASRGCVPACGC